MNYIVVLSTFLCNLVESQTNRKPAQHSNGFVTLFFNVFLGACSSSLQDPPFAARQRGRIVFPLKNSCGSFSLRAINRQLWTFHAKSIHHVPLPRPFMFVRILFVLCVCARSIGRVSQPGASFFDVPLRKDGLPSASARGM